MTDDEVAAILSKKVAEKPKSSKSLSDDYVASILMKENAPKKEASELAHKTRLVGENVAKGVIDISDLPETYAYGMGAYPGNPIAAPIEPVENPFSGMRPKAGEAIKSGIKSVGVDLDATKPKSGVDRILAKGARFAGNVVPGGFFGGIKAGLKGMASMFGSGTVAGGLHEVGVPEPLADIAGVIGAPAAVVAGKGLMGSGKNILAMFSPAARERIVQEGAESAVSDYLKNIIQESPSGTNPEKLQSTIKNIEESLGEMGPSRTGYMPTTYEASGDIALSQLAQPRRDILGSGIKEAEMINTQRLAEALESQKRGSEGVPAAQQYLTEKKRALEQAAESELKSSGVDETGKAIREPLFAKMQKHKKERREAAHPLYEKVRETKETHEPKTTKKYIDEELEIAKGDIRQALLKAKDALEPNKKSSKPSSSKGSKKTVTIQDIIGSFKQKNPELYKMLGVEEAGNGLRYIELENSRKAINQMMRKAKIAGERETAGALKRVVSKLDEDMANVPGIKEARNKYAEMSKPISEMESVPGIKQSLKKDVYENKFILGDAEIPEKFIATSMKSKENAKSLKEQIGGDRTAMEATHNYIANKAAREIVNEYGEVVPSKLKSWVEKNEGSFELFPNLKTGLHNKTNAQMMVDKLTGENTKLLNEFNKGMAKEILGADSHKVLTKIYGQKDAIEASKKIRKELAKDGSGGALTAYRNAAIDHFIQNTKTTGEGITYHKVQQYLKKHGAAMAEVLEPEAMKVINEVEKALSLRNTSRAKAATLGSPTLEKGANLAHAMLSSVADNAFSKTLSKLPGADLIMKPFHAIMKTDAALRAENLIRRALTDKEFALKLLTKVDSKEAGEAMKYITSRWKKGALPVINSLTHKEEE